MDLSKVQNKLGVLNAPKGEKREKVDYEKVLWKPKKPGKYQIRIVNSKYDPAYPFKEVSVHYGFAKWPIYALSNWGEKDPIVEFVKILKSSDDKENWTLAGKIYPKTRIFAPVVVRGEEEKGVRLWEFGKEIYTQLLGIADDEDYGDYTDINEGRDFTIDAVEGVVADRKGIKCTIRIKPKTSPLSTDPSLVTKWLEEQPNILEIQRKYTFEELKAILEKWLNPSDEVEAETENTDTEETEEAEEKLPFVPNPPKSSAAKPNPKAEKFNKLFEEE